MRKVFPGHFRPKEEDFNILWSQSTFVVDANVILNLYRYSDATRNELQMILETLKDRVFIPHQAAEEFLRNKLVVTAEQSNEYTTTIKDVEGLVKKITSKDRHPFIDEEAVSEFETFAKKLTTNLKEKQDSLLKKLTNDEILDFIENIFEERTGLPYTNIDIENIVKDGEARYQQKIPPGYKDNHKENPSSPHRKYGDLIVWYQTIDYSKENEKPIIFITDDKKEDWWLEQSGRTIGPRPELVAEFKEKSGQDFWMYSVSRFVQEFSSRNDNEVAREILTEIESVSAELERQQNIMINHKSHMMGNKTPSIITSQTPILQGPFKHEGIITITLQRNMKYATGSGKFTPDMIDFPDFHATLIATAEGINEDGMKIGFGCGTTKDFHIHLKAKEGDLPSGDYSFYYVAECDDTFYLPPDYYENDVTS